jgi:foldase protein PrsA
MPKAKRRAVRSKKEIKTVSHPNNLWQENADSLSDSNLPSAKTSNKKRNIIIIIIALLGLLLWWGLRGNIIVAFVNGQPITRFELNNLLVRRFGQQSLDTLINERLILGSARQKGVYITPKDIDQKVSDITKRLEGKMTLDEALKYQGMTQDEFKKQIEIQLTIDKLFEKDSTVSAKEIDDYIQKNSQLAKTSTDPAQLREDVKSILQQQKTTEAFDTWFTQIQKQAKIQRFL